VINHLQEQGVEKIIFSLGYKSEAFIHFLSETLPIGSYSIVIEEEPLGTGGAIQFACKKATEKNLVIVNGDSIFKVDLAKQADFHFSHASHCTLALKPMNNFERYGVVELNPDQSIALFKEKQFYQSGLINGGVYLLNVAAFLEKGLPEKFSFETEFLQQFYSENKMYGVIQDAYFIDIGIPEDYLKAQTELSY
jgi:D-glycero-alpha-D-manno-heptose 1-phosphate guanylyltransferase